MNTTSDTQRLASHAVQPSLEHRTLEDRTLEDRTLEDRTLEDRTLEDRTLKHRTHKQQLVQCCARLLLGCHLPVGQLTKPLYRSLYAAHVGSRELLGWTCRFFWYEPLLRSQCESVGRRFQMEQLPYMVGRGRIVLGTDVRLSGKSSFHFSSRYQLPQLIIGDGSFLGHNCAITVADRVCIGNHCLIAGGVRITDFDGHPQDPVERRAAKPAPAEMVQPVCIGDDVWIGHGAMILKGVHVGDRSIVGARAVVTKDVPEDCVVAGNPARIVKSLSRATPKSA